MSCKRRCAPGVGRLPLSPAAQPCPACRPAPKSSEHQHATAIGRAPRGSACKPRRPCLTGTHLLPASFALLQGVFDLAASVGIVQHGRLQGGGRPEGECVERGPLPPRAASHTWPLCFGVSAAPASAFSC